MEVVKHRDQHGDLHGEEDGAALCPVHRLPDVQRRRYYYQGHGEQEQQLDREGLVGLQVELQEGGWVLLLYCVYPVAASTGLQVAGADAGVWAGAECVDQGLLGVELALQVVDVLGEVPELVTLEDVDEFVCGHFEFHRLV